MYKLGGLGGDFTPNPLKFLNAAKMARAARFANEAEAAKRAEDEAQLQRALSELNRANARVGDGSTADAVRHERRTGELLSRTGHSKKARDRIRELRNLIRGGNLSSSSVACAEREIENLENALNS